MKSNKLMNGIALLGLAACLWACGGQQAQQGGAEETEGPSEYATEAAPEGEATEAASEATEGEAVLQEIPPGEEAVTLEEQAEEEMFRKLGEDELAKSDPVPEAFVAWFRQFATDQAFQENHVATPLKYSTLDLEMDEWHHELQEEWPELVNFGNDTASFYLGPDQFVGLWDTLSQGRIAYVRQGIDNGIHAEYYFSPWGDVWKLDSIRDRSN